MSREIRSRPCGTHQHDDLGLLVIIDIGENYFFNRSVAGTNDACSEESCFIPG